MAMFLSKSPLQLYEAFLMIPEILCASTPVNLTLEQRNCFCNEQRPDVSQDNDDSSAFRRMLGIQLLGPVSHQYHKKLMQGLMHVSFYGIIKYCLRMWLFEKGMECVYDECGHE